MEVVEFHWDELTYGRRAEFGEWLREHRYAVAKYENGHYASRAEDAHLYDLDRIGETVGQSLDAYCDGPVKFRVYFTDKHVATKAMLLWK